MLSLDEDHLMIWDGYRYGPVVHGHQWIRFQYERGWTSPWVLREVTFHCAPAWLEEAGTRARFYRTQALNG